MTDTVWTNGSGDGKASTPGNWSSGIGVDYNLIFNATSTSNCTFDYTGQLGTITIGSGYTGTITQTVEMYIGSFSQAAGIFTPTGLFIHINGNLTKTGGTFTVAAAYLEMSGEGGVITTNTDISPKILTISGNTTINSSLQVNWELNIASGKVLTLTNNLLCLVMYSSHSFILNNQGEITGTGSLNLYVKDSASHNVTYGTLTVQVRFILSSGASADRTFTFDSNLITTKVVAVDSQHATYTLTVDLAGYDITSSAPTLAARGILTSSVAGSEITGNVVVNGTGAVLTQGEGIALTINGNLTVTSGTLTQLGPITLNGNYSQGGGTFAPNLNTLYMSQGVFDQSAGSISADSLTLSLTGGELKNIKAVVLKLITHNTVSITLPAYNFVRMLVNDGTLNITNELNVGMNSAPYTFTNTGVINGKIIIWLYNNNVSVTLGNGTDTRLATRSSAVGNYKCTLLGPVVGLTNIYSEHATYTCTLDLNGKNLKAGSITVGTRGVLQCGEGKIETSALDSSAGTLTQETATWVIKGAIPTVKLAAGQKLYNVIAQSRLKLLSDVTVQNLWAHLNPVEGSYTLTHETPTNEWTGLARLKSKGLLVDQDMLVTDDLFRGMEV